VSRPGLRLRLRFAVVGVLAAVAVSCTNVPAPEGAAPLRYRDRVFQDVTVTTDIQYGSAPDRNGAPVALRLDLYRPAGDTVTERPAVVWAHGGGFSGGDKSRGPSPALARLFAQLGYVTVSINYRLLAASGCGGSGAAAQCTDAALAAVEDGKAAVRWLRANAAAYGIDPDRIAMGGESAGGIMAAGAGLGPESAGNSGNPGHSNRVQAWISISGGIPGGGFVDRGDSPGYLFSGTEDRVVPHQWSVETAAAMLRNGNFVVLKTMEGAGHVPFEGANRTLIETQSINFLYRLLDLEHAAR
jgi:dienelactone hydrolase